jgi:2-oxoglutarate dehydrogenase E2 component (dihydrolipoamide succinyltransferase)
MAETKVIMPQMGESIFEGTLTKWLKKKGDRVERDEPLFEISTDKVDSEIPSPAAGVLQDILVQEGQTVEINTVVAVIGDGSQAGAPAEKPEARQETKPAAKPEVKAAPETTDQDRTPTVDMKPGTQQETPGQPQTGQAPPPRAQEPVKGQDEEEGAEDVQSSPLVRKIAKEHGIDLSLLAGKGTGMNGRITKSDILSYIEQGGPKQKEPAREVPQQKQAPPAPSAPPRQAPPAFTGDVERVPMSNIRKLIAEHMVMSRRTSAHVTTIFEIDCARIMKVREQLQPEFARAGTRLTVTAFFVQAAVESLKKFPLLNASIDGDSIVYRKAVHIGIAVSVESGLIVPVIKNAEEKSLQGIAVALQDIGERARTKKLTPDDVQGGTFTITNPGQYGQFTATPIINQPQLAIMGMGNIKKRAVVVDDAIAIRPMIMLALSFDHRAIDGAMADQFMAEVQKHLENWPLQ